MTAIQFSNEGIQRLTNRSLSSQEIKHFSDIINKATQEGGSPQDYLNSLSYEDLKLVQKANSLADSINVEQLSTEGAKNLLARPDGSDLVDLNNDGIVEVGIAKTIRFPPVNAPQFVKDAWQKSTEEMSFEDKIILELNMHIHIYGVQLEGVPQKNALSPQQQWSTEGIKNLFSDLYSNLEFRVGLEGWTEHNRMLSDFYNNFEQELTGVAVIANLPTTPNSPVQSGKSHTTTGADSDNDKTSDEYEELKKLNQLVLDARLGIDRKKLEEIDKEMKAVENDDSLTKEQKQQKLKALLEEKERILQEAQKRAVEEEKRKATLNDPVTDSV